MKKLLNLILSKVGLQSLIGGVVVGVIIATAFSFIVDYATKKPAAVASLVIEYCETVDAAKRIELRGAVKSELITQGCETCSVIITC